MTYPRLPLRRSFRIINGGTPTPELENWGGEIPWATPVDLGAAGLTIEHTERMLTEAGLASSSKLAPAGSILISTRAPIGHLAVCAVAMAFNQGCRALAPIDDSDPRFFAYHLMAERSNLELAGQGSTFLELSSDALATFRLSTPPVDEQRRIADFLDDQVACLDRAIALRQRQRRLTASRSRQCLRAVIDARGGTTATGIPWLPVAEPGWRTSRLKYHAISLDARRVPLSGEERSTRNGPYPYYGASTIVDYVDGYLFDEELVLMGEDGASLDNPNFDVVQRVSGPCWVNNHAHVLRADKSVRPDYLAAYLRGADRWFLISGATRPKITQEDLMSLPVLVPPLPIQDELIEELETAASAQAAIDVLSERHVGLLEERKRALITAAVTGQLDVTAARAVAS